MNVHPEFYNPYLEKVPDQDVIKALKSNMQACGEIYSNVDEEKSTYRYAEGKWSLRELLGHIIDAERVFSYRAMCFARADKTPLPGFDENDYASRSNAHLRSMKSLKEEFMTLRLSTIQLFSSFSDAQLSEVGTMSGNQASVHAIGRIIAGHCAHHLEVIQERYL